jgi:hypothetical protein
LTTRLLALLPEQPVRETVSVMAQARVTAVSFFAVSFFNGSFLQNLK